MTTTVEYAAALRDRLVNELRVTGCLTTPRWTTAFRAVPRELFVTRFAVPDRVGRYVDHDLTDPRRHPAALAAVYTDTTLITQFTGTTATSSSTTPSLMATMLEALAAQPGQSVLEIGTGTGYNAALLSHALGSAAVTTVEVDADLAATARDSLARAGYAPTVVCANGAAGVPEHAPYDRLIATCGVTRVPPAWLAQVRVGGVVVVNVSFGVAVLTVTEPGAGSGRFIGPAGFMSLRGPDATEHRPPPREVAAAAAGPGRQRQDDALPADVFTTPAVAFLRALCYPSLGHHVLLDVPDSPVHLYDPTRASWARATPTGTGRVTVTSGGPADVWAEFTALIASWTRHGRPDIDRYGLTVQPHGDHLLWLDAPHQVVAELV